MACSRGPLVTHLGLCSNDAASASFGTICVNPLFVLRSCLIDGLISYVDSSQHFGGGGSCIMSFAFASASHDHIPPYLPYYI